MAHVVPTRASTNPEMLFKRANCAIRPRTAPALKHSARLVRQRQADKTSPAHTRLSIASVRTPQQATSYPLEVSQQKFHVEPTDGSSRRSAVLSAAAALLAGSLQPARTLAEDADLMDYTDEVDGYSISVPKDWVQGLGEAEGSLSSRRVVAFYPAENATTNVNIIATNISADFTKMGSFGNAFDFGTRLVGSLDGAYRDKNAQHAVLEDARDSGGSYIVDYTLEKPDEFNRHLLSIVTIGSNPKGYNRLYTVTAQCNQEDYANTKALFSSIIKSFKLAPN